MDNTEIVVILDRSGSMQAAKNDHEGGLKSFVEDQKGLAGDVRFTLIRFDTEDPCEVVYDGLPIGKVQKIELVPRGGTPLLDAMGRGLAHVEARLDREQRNPDQVVVMVITDGEENSSREWTKAQVAERVKALEAMGWHFLFLAANVDAFAEAGAVGVGAQTTSSFANTAQGTHMMYASMTANTLKNRKTIAQVRAVCGTYDRNTNVLDYAWSDTQRNAMKGEEDGTVPGSGDPAADEEGKGRRRRGRGGNRPAAGGDGS